VKKDNFFLRLYIYNFVMDGISVSSLVFFLFFLQEGFFL
jgi:hypothetical protein